MDRNVYILVEMKFLLIVRKRNALSRYLTTYRHLHVLHKAFFNGYCGERYLLVLSECATGVLSWMISYTDPKSLYCRHRDYVDTHFDPTAFCYVMGGLYNELLPVFTRWVNLC